MLIDFNHTYDFYQEITGHYGTWEFACPKCKEKGHLHRHAFYDRFFCVFEKNQVKEEVISVLRLKCDMCKSTHAVLTWDMIPFCVYSFFLILTIVKMVLVEKQSVLKVAMQTEISFQVIYHFLHLWELCRKFYNELPLVDQGHFFNQYITYDSLLHNEKEHVLKQFLSKTVPLFSKRKNSEKHPLYFG